MDVAEFCSIRKPRYKDHDEAIVVLRDSNRIQTVVDG